MISDDTREFIRRKRRAHLRDATIRRRGITAKQWYGQTDIAFASGGRDRNPDALSLYFTLPAGGRGETAIEIAIKAKDFPAILALMSAADRNATLKAMAEEMRYQLCGNSK